MNPNPPALTVGWQVSDLIHPVPVPVPFPSSSIHPVSQYFWAVGSLAPCLPLHRFITDLPPILPFYPFHLSFLHSLICMQCPADFPFSRLSFPFSLTFSFLYSFLFLYHWPLSMPDAVPPVSHASPFLRPSVGMLMNATCLLAQLLRLVHFHIKCRSAAKVQRRREGTYSPKFY